MTFDQFEKASKRDLREKAKECFEKSQDETVNPMIRSGYILEAQLYTTELERRQSSRIALRDLLLELVVIALIGWEIYMSYGDDKLMNKQNGILSGLQQSTSDTASTIKGLLDMTRTMNETAQTTARTMRALQSDMDATNKGVHDQLSLFYDPAIVLVYQSDSHRLLFQNNGRTNITLNALKIWDGPEQIQMHRVIVPSAAYYFDIETMYKKLTDSVPKGSTQSIPVIAEIRNETGKIFRVTSNLYVIWEHDTLTIHAQTYSITPVATP